ncbi:MAG: hypothetical protein PCFJNLEI_01304 [Verrucomicrobiae bacterium]|nr:hypothetical protein [Verrucomicrobiae bacterium]
MKVVRYTAATLVLAAALTGSHAAAQGTDSIIDLLVRKGIVTEREAKDLKTEADADLARAMNRANKTKVASWIDEMKWSGDLRLRGEFFDNEDQANTVDRWRYRYRLRLGVESKMKSWATVGLRLASGDANDPVSTNESFDDTFQKDPLQIDAAYVIIKPPAWDWVSLTAGKMLQAPYYHPSFNSPLVYDNDATPEGVVGQFVFNLDDEKRHSLFANVGGYLLNEIGASSDTDGYLLDAQVGGELRFGGEPKTPTVRVRAAGGLFLTDNVNIGAQQADSPNLGNAVDNTGNIVDDFEVVHVGGEIAWQISNKPFLGTPAIVTVSAEYVKNLANGFDSLNQASTNLVNLSSATEGYSGQISFGSARKKGEWQLAYQYKYLEADAVYDGLTDSDWGTGGTDRKGHVLRGSYNFQEWWQLGITAFFTEKVSNRGGPNTIAAANPDDTLLRVQIDNVFKF